jgi:hypothetical protein
MEANELIKTIELAFQNVKKPKTSLRQFKLTDEKGMSEGITEAEWNKAKKVKGDSIWQGIPDSEIEECGCLLAHMQAEEFQYYLPAYMRYSVKHYQQSILESDILGSTVFSLYPSSKDKGLYQYQIAQLSLLDEKQKTAIVKFLQFVETVADEEERPYATKALERYWYKNVHT